MSRAARDHNVKVTVGQIESFNPAVRALADYDINPAFIEAHRLAAFDPRGTDVAVVLDLMIHDIDLVLMFIKSDIVDIQASAVAVVSEQVDIANARMTFDNGAVANLTASRISLNPMRKAAHFPAVRLFLARSGPASRPTSTAWPDPVKRPRDSDCRWVNRGQDIIYVKKEDDGQDMLAAELDAFLDGSHRQ